MTPLNCIGLLAMMVVDTHASARTPITPSKTAVNQSITRAISFLDADQIKWKKEKRCISCHHGTMTVWALAEAKAAGFVTGTSTLADLSHDSFGTQGALIRNGMIINPASPPQEAKFNVVSVSAYNLLMAAPVLGQLDDASQNELKLIARDIAKRQNPDGSWLAPPHGNGPPPVYESSETMTLWALIGLASGPIDRGFEAEVRSSQERGHAWLEKNPSSKTPQTVTLRLLLELREGKPAGQTKRTVNELFRMQQPDGGWRPTPELASDAFATGEALYVLNLAGVKSDRKEIAKGVAFLLANQAADGSWPMTPRAHSDSKPFKSPAPIVHSGTGWATIALIRSQATQPVSKSVTPTTTLPDP